MNIQYWTDAGFGGRIVRTALRTLQFIFAIMVAALYGVDLHHASTTHTHANPTWVFAEAVAALSAITCIIHGFVVVKRLLWSMWDGVLMVLWAACFGSSAAVILGRSILDDSGTTTVLGERMNVAVWFDLINMLLWLATTIHGCASCISGRRLSRPTDKMQTAQITDAPKEERRAGNGWIEPPSYDRLFSKAKDGK